MPGDFEAASRETGFSVPALQRGSVYARFLHLALTDRQLDEAAADELVYHAARMAHFRRTDLTDAIHASVKRLISASTPSGPS